MQAYYEDATGRVARINKIDGRNVSGEWMISDTPTSEPYSLEVGACDA